MSIETIHTSQLDSTQLFYILILGVGIRLLYVLFKQVLKSSSSDQSIESAKSTNHLSVPKQEIPHGGESNEIGVRVQVFDEFRVWIDGKPIHYSDWESKKARELFLYLLLKNHHGVSKEDIELTFWPDAHNGSAANSRAVALSRIRKTLGLFSSLIQKQDDRIRLGGGDNLKSDYQTLNKKIADIPLSISQMSLEPLKLYGKEGLLPDFHQDWVAGIQTDIERKISQYAKKTATQAMDEEKWDIVDWIGERLLMWNGLDDDGLRFRVIANKQMGKPGVANDIYYKYFNHYEYETGDIYKIPFEKIQ